MTRTARNAFPRAINRDRSQSKSGMDKSLKKEGAGKGNWGKLGEIEQDEITEYDSEGDLTVREGSQAVPIQRKRSTSVPDEKEIEAARELRKHAFNGEVDLATIARTSVAVSSSPPTHSIPVGSDASGSQLSN